MSRAELQRWILCLAAGVLFACAPTMPSEDLEKIVRGSTFDRVGDYKIGASDSLTIRVFGEDALSGSFVVTPSGTIQFPLIGFVKAGGLTAVQLARFLEINLRPFVREAKVAVSIADTLSYRVFFSGEIQTRGVRELRTKTSVLEGVILAGGLTDFASGRIYLIRRIDERVVRRYVTTYDALLKGRKLFDAIYLERGDIIHAE
jgi:polysaccharide export outer membrane protein